MEWFLAGNAAVSRRSDDFTCFSNRIVVVYEDFEIRSSVYKCFRVRIIAEPVAHLLSF